MDKIKPKTSFGQWFSPINLQLFEEMVKTMKLDYYTKKLTKESFLKLLVFAQLVHTPVFFTLVSLVY